MNTHLEPLLSDSLELQPLRLIASGGMSHVYEAQHKGLGPFRKRVALKVIRPELCRIKAFRDNFMGEAMLMADLVHPNIVQIYHLGQKKGRYYMTMEYVDGLNLEDFIGLHRSKNHPIPVDLAAFITSRICRALAYAHRKRDDQGELLGIVHRDVAPRNILLGFEGDVKLADFGIAKALQLMYNREGHVIAGRTEYLSPEQARREVTDARADLFSCGVVLLELLLGYNPFEDEEEAQTRHNILHMPLPSVQRLRPEVTDELAQIVYTALARPCQERYPDAQAMLTALELHLYGKGYGPTHEKLAAYLDHFLHIL